MWGEGETRALHPPSPLAFPLVSIHLKKSAVPFSEIFTCKYTSSTCCSHSDLSREMLKTTPVQPVSETLVSEATVRTGHGTTDWFQIGKEHIKAVCCHPAYLTYMQSTSCEMLGWMMQKLESRLPGEITTSDMQMTPP